MTDAKVSAESVVRQKLYFPTFKDGGPHVGDLLLLCYPGAVWGCAADNDNDRPRPRPVT